MSNLQCFHMIKAVVKILHQQFSCGIRKYLEVIFQTEQFKFICFKVSCEFCKGILPAVAVYQLPKIFLSKKVLINRKRWKLCSV